MSLSGLWLEVLRSIYVEAILSGEEADGIGEGIVAVVDEEINRATGSTAAEAVVDVALHIHLEAAKVAVGMEWAEALVAVACLA